MTKEEKQLLAEIAIPIEALCLCIEWRSLNGITSEIKKSLLNSRDIIRSLCLSKEENGANVVEKPKTPKSERFIMVENKNPNAFVVYLEDKKNPMTTRKLTWQIIDRGPNFIVGDESSIQERIIAWFSYKDKAQHLLNILTAE